MEKLIMFMMILASCLSFWVKDVEIVLMDRAFRTIQYGLEHAVHDAALQVEIMPLSEGFIVFDQPKAEEVMLESIQHNLPVDSMLSPSSDIFFTEPLKIIDIVYLDDNFVGSFPMTWEYMLPNGKKFERAIFGPSVALIVDVKVQGAGKTTPFVVIQEYKGYEG